jgi:hypothetical protein
MKANTVIKGLEFLLLKVSLVHATQVSYDLTVLVHDAVATSGVTTIVTEGKHLHRLLHH